MKKLLLYWHPGVWNNLNNERIVWYNEKFKYIDILIPEVYKRISKNYEKNLSYFENKYKGFYNNIVFDESKLQSFYDVVVVENGIYSSWTYKYFCKQTTSTIFTKSVIQSHDEYFDNYYYIGLVYEKNNWILNKFDYKMLITKNAFNVIGDKFDNCFYTPVTIDADFKNESKKQKIITSINSNQFAKNPFRAFYLFDKSNYMENGYKFHMLGPLKVNLKSLIIDSLKLAHATMFNPIRMWKLYYKYYFYFIFNSSKNYNFIYSDKWLQKEEILKYISVSEIYLSTTNHESIAIHIIEAYLSGNIIINNSNILTELEEINNYYENDLEAISLLNSSYKGNLKSHNGGYNIIKKYNATSKKQFNDFLKKICK